MLGWEGTLNLNPQAGGSNPQCPTLDIPRHSLIPSMAGGSAGGVKPLPVVKSLGTGAGFCPNPQADTAWDHAAALRTAPAGDYVLKHSQKTLNTLS